MYRTAIIMLLFCHTVNADRKIWYVHPESTLCSIQAALDSCADNDIVLVARGTYFGDLLWPNAQGVKLISERGPDVTRIYGGGRVISIGGHVDSTTLVRGFTIQGACMPHGCGIYCEYASPTIADNIIVDNFSKYGGGGIWCEYGAPVITNNTIRNCISDQGAGGIMITCDSGTPVITKNTITDNDVDEIAGGIFILADSSYVAYNIITGNDNAGIECAGYAAIINNIVSDNDEGIIVYGPNQVSIVGNTVSNNLFNGIRCYSPTTIANNIITGNDSSGIICADNIPAIDSCTISQNGYGIFCTHVNPPIHYCNIVENLIYGVYNDDSMFMINAENNWWGDVTGPFHPDSNPGGLGNKVSDYVDFTPWLNHPVGVKENKDIPVNHYGVGATIFSGLLRLPPGKTYRIYDIAGRKVTADKMKPGVYFVKIEGSKMRKVVKVR